MDLSTFLSEDGKIPSFDMRVSFFLRFLKHRTLGAARNLTGAKPAAPSSETSRTETVAFITHIRRLTLFRKVVRSI